MINRIRRKRIAFVKKETGVFTAEAIPKNFNNVYTDAVIRYLNCLEPLFEKAKGLSEFQFILTLLRVRGVQDAGWDPYENSLRTFKAITDLEKQLRGEVRENIYLWLYGHIVEASEPYETVANLLNICNGQGFRTYNFPKRKTAWGYRNQFPSEKIQYIENLSKKVRLPKIVVPFKEVLDKDLRNAVFHADYSIYNGQVRLNDPPRIISAEDSLAIVNKALAYHEVIKNLIDIYRSSYTGSRIIDVPKSFSQNPEEKATVIIRKEYGVTALKAAWTKEQIQRGEISWFLGHYLPYERKYLDRGDVVLPKNKIEFWNKILDKLPEFIARLFSKFIDRYLY